MKGWMSPAAGCDRLGPQIGSSRKIFLSILGLWPVGAGGFARPERAQNPSGKSSESLLPSPNPETPVLPPQVPPEKCRCAVGSILSEGEESPSSELIQLYQKFGFKVFSFPAPSHVVTATFPYTSTLSIWLATRRVHPALDAYIKVRDRPGVCVCWGKASPLGESQEGLLMPGGKAGLGRAASWDPHGADACGARNLGRGYWYLSQMPKTSWVPEHLLGACSET